MGGWKPRATQWTQVRGYRNQAMTEPCRDIVIFVLFLFSTEISERAGVMSG